MSHNIKVCLKSPSIVFRPDQFSSDRRYHGTRRPYRRKTGVFLSLVIAIGWIAGCLSPSEPGLLVRPTVDHDPTLPSIELNGTRFHLETFGKPENPPIFFQHGGPGGDYRSFLPLIERYDGMSLVDDYYVIFWDQRGAGLSRRHSDPSKLTREVYLSDLESVIDEYATDRQAILVGHSWGGLYTAMYIDAHPNRIAGAIFFEPDRFTSALDSGPGTPAPYFSEWVNDFTWARQFIEPIDHERADYFIQIVFTENTQPQRHNDFFPQWRYGFAAMLYLDKDMEERRFDYTKKLGNFTPEVLFIVGGDTEDVGLDFQEKQRKYFQRSRIETIPNAGHYDIICWRAEESSAFMRDYLESLDLTGTVR